MMMMTMMIMMTTRTMTDDDSLHCLRQPNEPGGPDVAAVIGAVESRLALPIHQVLTEQSTINTLRFLFYHMRSGGVLVLTGMAVAYVSYGMHRIIVMSTRWRVIGSSTISRDHIISGTAPMVTRRPKAMSVDGR
jgi:hypothetical protein